jgi:hypothetical protein
MATQHFGSASFQDEYWVNSKGVFHKPIGVDVEFTTSGDFDWVFADENGVEVKTVHHNNHSGWTSIDHSGWTSIDFASLGLFGDYSIGFRNASTVLQQIKQVDVRLP